MTAASRLGDIQDTTFASASAATAESLETPKRLSGAAIERFLDDRQYATLATTRPGGRPHAAMTAFVQLETEIWAPAMPGTQRVRNVAAIPWAVVIVSDGEGDGHTMVSIEGSARLDMAPGPAVVDAWMSKFEWMPDWAEEWVVVGVRRLRSYGADGSDYREDAP